MTFEATSKTQLRSLYRRARQGLPERQRSDHDKAINRHILSLVLNLEPLMIGAFWPFDGEPDLSPALRELNEQGIGVALPHLGQGTARRMDFNLWLPNQAMTRNSFGIEEMAANDAVELSSLDLLLMPLVAYDHCGQRLGMGAGYYDRYLQDVRKSAVPYRVGVAYSAQQVPSLPTDDWDVPLHGIINEHGWFTFPF